MRAAGAIALTALVFSTSTTPRVSAQGDANLVVPPNAFKDLKWRSVGATRGGRVTAYSGVRQQPHTFYFGGVGPSGGCLAFQSPVRSQRGVDRRSRAILPGYDLRYHGLLRGKLPRDAEIVNAPFMGVLAGCSARRYSRRVASHASEEQRRNAPASAARNGTLAVSASLRAF